MAKKKETKNPFPTIPQDQQQRDVNVINQIEGILNYAVDLIDGIAARYEYDFEDARNWGKHVAKEIRIFSQYIVDCNNDADATSNK